LETVLSLAEAMRDARLWDGADRDALTRLLAPPHPVHGRRPTADRDSPVDPVHTRPSPSGVSRRAGGAVGATSRPGAVVPHEHQLHRVVGDEGEAQRLVDLVIEVSAPYVGLGGRGTGHGVARELLAICGGAEPSRTRLRSRRPAHASGRGPHPGCPWRGLLALGCAWSGRCPRSASPATSGWCRAG